MKTTKNKALYIARECAIVGLIFMVAYFSSKPINSWLGQRAIDNTGLNYLSYAEAMAKSQSSGKPVLMEFSAIWCSSCRRLDAQVFSNEAVKEKINAGYLFTRLEYESDQDQKIFQKYGIKGYPVVMVVNAKGKSTRRLGTTFNADEFLEQI